MAKKPSKSRKVSVYSNLARKRKIRKDTASRKRAEYLATLPKHPVKRIIYRMHPKRVAGFWFSKRGLMLTIKLAGVGILLGVLMVGGLFAYYRKDLDSIQPGELPNRVQTTVTTYLDRNGKPLWEDKGDGNYTLAVKSEDISDNMKQATIAIEDKDFYSHKGISISGIIRSAFNNLRGESIQGGSTLTQQLVKQAFFTAEETRERGLKGIPRKIKEAILAIEIERMYDKEQILTLYLNESSYGGRRNGVESGAQSYFLKSAKELTLPEAALLAAIPNQPGLYDPYNVSGNKALIARQHKVLDDMVSKEYITKKQAKEAKEYPILDSIEPAADQFKNIKAPHFVQMVRSQLESELGRATVGRGGLIVKTTLDLRIQNKLEESIDEMFKSSTPTFAGFTNSAATVEDTQTGQIVAMSGSRDFNYPGFGQDNAATAYIQPGSAIKPFVYASLMAKKSNDSQNYGSGSILADDSSMDDIYGAPLRNADGGYRGNITIRKSLGVSRNIPAVKAMYIAGVNPTLDLIRDMGVSSYCTQGADKQAGLAAAIGGCGLRQIDLVNGFATFGRDGVHKPTSTILEVKNSQGQIIKKHSESAGERVLNPEVSYIISDILHDDNARAGLYGPHFYGLYIPGVDTAVKTGTSDKGGKAKDIWTVSYSPALSMGVWLGNPDTSTLLNGNSSLPASIIGKVMEYAHKEVYAKDGKWKPGEWLSRPSGVKTIKGELYPSWYDTKQGQKDEEMVFDRVSKRKATKCTPEGAKEKIGVIKMMDPITKKDVFITPDDYDATKEDNVHKCNDSKPQITNISPSHAGGSKYTITVTVDEGKHDIQTVTIKINGQTAANLKGNSSGVYTTTYTVTDNSPMDISVTAVDKVYYSHTSATSYTPTDIDDDEEEDDD